MATTPNYGWVTPAPTDFVVDLPADFETFADAVDASVKALNPGTTAGDIDYYTNATTKTRLGIGTSGQVLTVNSGGTAPQWSTPASAGKIQIASGTLSGSIVNISSISAGYKDLFLVIRNFRPATDGATLAIRLNADSGTRYAGQDGSGTLPFNISSGLSGSGATDNGASNSLITINFYDYANTTTWKMFNTIGVSNNSTTATSAEFFRSNGFYNQTGAINAINLFCSSGNFTSGDYILYGVQ